MTPKRRKKRSQPLKGSSRIQETKKGGGRKTWALLAGALVLAVAAVALLAFFTQRDNNVPQPPALAEQTPEGALDKSVGSADAPVVVLEYGDFQ